MTPRRLLTIARASLLALALLLSQQLGMLHVLSHGAAAVGAHGVQASGAADAHAEAAGDTADALCQLCLLLASLAAVALPGLWRWLAPRLHRVAQRPPQAVRLAAAASAPYQARAPPR